MPSTILRTLALLGAGALVAPLAGCIEEGPTSPDADLAAFSLLGGLDVGQALSLSSSAAERLFLPGGEGGAEFVVVTFFGTEAEGSQITVGIDGSELVDVTGPPAGSAGSPPPTTLQTSRPAFPGDVEFHRELREAEIRELEPRLSAAPWRDTDGPPPLDRRGVAAPAPAAVPQVGDTIPLRVLNQSSTDICSNPHQRAGRVAAITPDVIMVSDTASPAELSDAQLQELASEFDQLVRPVEVEAFGEPTDIDENGRVVVFFTPIVNQQGVGGFHFAGDLFPRSECAASNEGEIFYIISPDPNGEANSNLPVDGEVVAQLATGIIGHEFQHLVNAGRRIYVNNATSFEAVWLNEGLSHIAEELLFYETTGLTPRENISFNRLVSSQEIAQGADRFVVQNLFQYAQYAATPSAATFLGSDNSETRGAAWSFLRYAADMEEGDDTQFWFDLVNSRTRGFDNLNAVLETANGFDLFQAWTASVFSDDQVTDLPPFLTQPSWNHRTILPFFFQDEQFPLDVRVVDGAGSVQVALTGGGAAFFRVSVDPASQGEFRIDLSGSSPEDLRVSVVRAE